MVSGATCTNDLETDRGSMNDRLCPFPLRISRQQAFDIDLDENHEIGNASKAKEDAENENDKVEGELRESKQKIDEEFQQASYRHFSSPAILDI